MVIAVQRHLNLLNKGEILIVFCIFFTLSVPMPEHIGGFFVSPV